LQKEPVREVDGEKELPISEVIKTFSPTEAFYFMAKMQQMLETIKATRLANLVGNEAKPVLNTFFGLDKDTVRGLATHFEWKTQPLAADEARNYEAYVEYMKAQARAKQSDAEAAADGGEPDSLANGGDQPPDSLSISDEG
jgi:hypothetical protein